MLKKAIRLLLLFGSPLLLGSCAFMSSAFNYNAKSPVFIAISRADESRTTYSLDGQDVTPEMKLFRSSSTTNGYITTTVSTYLPAILIRPDKQYHTLTIKNDMGTRNVLLKRDYKGAVLWLDMFLTCGVGNLVDIGTNAIFGYPMVDVSQLYSMSSGNIIIPSDH